jgi:uncharacterized protein with HEPN domain
VILEEKEAVFLKHVLEAISLIEGYVSGKVFADFEEDRQLQDAVLRRLEIIGQAVKNLPEGFKAKHSGIEWKHAMAMRDFVSHRYFSIDLQVVWDTIHTDLPRLKKQVEELLDSA